MLVLSAPCESLRVMTTHRFATCWKITRKDNVVFRFTTHDRTLSLPIANHTETFGPVASVSPSARQKVGGLKDRNLEVKGIIDVDNISFADLIAGKFRGASVVEMIVDWKYPWAGLMGVTYYNMGETKFNGEFWECQLEGMTVRMKQEVGRTYTRICDAIFCDPRCGLHSSDFLFDYTVTGVTTSNTTFTCSGTTRPLNDFAGGNVIWLTGQNAGINSDCLSYNPTGNAFTLVVPTTGLVQVGDTFEALIGCDHLVTTCSGKFNNIKNFRGFPYEPGTDRQIQTPVPKNGG